MKMSGRINSEVFEIRIAYELLKMILLVVKGWRFFLKKIIFNSQMNNRLLIVGQKEVLQYRENIKLST